MPKEWNWLTGHLLVLDKYMKRYAADANVALAMGDLSMKYRDTGVLLLDIRPYVVCFLVSSVHVASSSGTRINLRLAKRPLLLGLVVRDILTC